MGDINRFDLVCPADYRYLAEDKGFIGVNKRYEEQGLDILTKIESIGYDLIIPRIISLERVLGQITKENAGLKVPKRIDGLYQGEINIEDVWQLYQKRLQHRRQQIEIIYLDFGQNTEAEQNDKLSDLAYTSVSILAVQANIANDARHLFRSEIREYDFKHYSSKRIGSSTLPHKRNPIEFEKVVSFLKIYSPNVITGILSQITEHQGDSTNEVFYYFLYEQLAILSYVSNNLAESLQNLKINPK